MKKYVLDAHAVMAYLEGEEIGSAVIPILENATEGNAEIFMSVINWGEVYYIALREGGEDRAKLYMETLGNYPIHIVTVDKEAALSAAKYKAHYKMSYADAFAAGLAEHKNATLITGDKEFRQIEKKIKINFL